ncbi:MAG: hypothetical protein K2X03_27620 [Bryobacteraceae bacterium]|nr:hypothetical protein [Bryobacteraceae bacterium]
MAIREHVEKIVGRHLCATGVFLLLGIAVPAYAQVAVSEPVTVEAPKQPCDPQVASCMSPVERTQYCTKFVENKIDVWQRRLKLEGWKISVVMTKRADLKPRTLGGIRWDKGKKSAAMSVLDPSEYRVPFQAMLDDMELTVVHELVHLELASLPRSEASRSNEEHAVNGIAEALLVLDRKR